MSFTDWSFDKVSHDPKLFLKVYTTYVANSNKNITISGVIIKYYICLGPYLQLNLYIQQSLSCAFEMFTANIRNYLCQQFLHTCS